MFFLQFFKYELKRDDKTLSEPIFILTLYHYGLTVKQFLLKIIDGKRPGLYKRIFQGKKASKASNPAEG